jgi:hypothetical protein
MLSRIPVFDVIAVVLAVVAVVLAYQAAGVAVGGNGTLFVAELFRNRIAQVKPGGSPTRFLKAVLPGDIDIRRNGDLYATVQVIDEETGGKVVRIRR